MSTTTQMRKAWAPACSPKGDVFLEAYRAIDAVFTRWNYTVGKNTWTFNCRTITGGKGYSLHAYGPGTTFTFASGISRPTALALDVNSDRNPYGSTLITDMPMGMIAEIKAIRTRNGKQVWGWGGDYKSVKDAMHFEIIVTPADLRTGVIGVIAGWQPPAFPGTIKPGSTAERVAHWRVLLGALNYKGFKVGVYPWSSPLTHATRRFQKRHGLTVDGIVGPKTWAKACERLAQVRAKG